MLVWNKVGPRDLGAILTPRDGKYLRLFIHPLPFTGGLRMSMCSSHFTDNIPLTFSENIP